MKKLALISGAIAAVAATVASATIILSSEKQVQLERATRLSTLSVVAVKNGDYELACKAQREVVNALYLARVKGQDLIGTADAQRLEFCQKAHVSSMNEQRFFAG
jgi:hypothetical protein